MDYLQQDAGIISSPYQYKQYRKFYDILAKFCDLYEPITSAMN